MIDVLHARGCGALAFRVYGQPIGRDFMARDAMLLVMGEDGAELGQRPARIGEAIYCASCGGRVSLDEARDQVGTLDNTPGAIPPPPSELEEARAGDG